MRKRCCDFFPGGVFHRSRNSKTEKTHGAKVIKRRIAAAGLIRGCKHTSLKMCENETVQVTRFAALSTASFVISALHSTVNTAQVCRCFRWWLFYYIGNRDWNSGVGDSQKLIQKWFTRFLQFCIKGLAQPAVSLGGSNFILPVCLWCISMFQNKLAPQAILPNATLNWYPSVSKLIQDSCGQFPWVMLANIILTSDITRFPFPITTGIIWK